MKDVFFVRHAKSSWKDMSLDDHDRPLNKRGMRDAPFMADILTKRQLKIDRFISSTALRALTTCKYFCKAYGSSFDEIHITRHLYHAHESSIVEVLRQNDPSVQSIAIFGHNPGFTYILDSVSRP